MVHHSECIAVSGAIQDHVEKYYTTTKAVQKNSNLYVYVPCIFVPVLSLFFTNTVTDRTLKIPDQVSI